MRAEAQMWWDEAEAELVAARNSLAAGDYHVCAFLCQQAVERGLKALWIEHRKEMPPKTHDITDLGKRLDMPERFFTALKELNPLFATTRYPDAANGAPVHMYDDAIARERLGDSEEVMAWCRNELKQS